MKHGVLAILISVFSIACGQEETIVREVITTTEVSVPVTGETGANGSSCEITESTTASYITCNGKTTQTVDGRDGMNGTDGTTPTENDVDLNEFYRERIGSVPKIEAYRKLGNGTLQKLWHGSGVVVAQDVVVTNYHVCQNLDEFVTSDHGYTNTIKVSYPYANRDGADQDFEASYFTTKFVTSIDRDLCLLQVPTGNRTVFEMMPSDEVGIMDKLMSIGYPLEFDFVGSVGYAETITTGIYPWIATDTVIIQTSSLIDAGNSGGPSFHVESGKIAGINFGAYMGYNTHAHMLAMEYVQQMNPTTAIFRDSDTEVIDLNAMIKTPVMIMLGYLKNDEVAWSWDVDYLHANLVAGQKYMIETTHYTDSGDPIEGVWVDVFTPSGNYVWDGAYEKGKFRQYVFEAPETGEYDINVSTYWWDDAGYYLLKVSRLTQATGSSYIGPLTARFTSNNSSLHMFVNPSDWVNGYVTPGANVSIVNDLPITINGRIDTDLSYADNQWLDQLWLDDSDSTTITMTITECSMSWRVTRASLLISNGASGYNFIPHIEAYDADNNGIPDQGTCVLTSQSGTVIPPN